MATFIVHVEPWSWTAKNWISNTSPLLLHKTNKDQNASFYHPWFGEKGLLIFHLLSRRLEEENHTGEGRGNQANVLGTLLRDESMNQANDGCRSVVKLSRTWQKLWRNLICNSLWIGSLFGDKIARKGKGKFPAQPKACSQANLQAYYFQCTTKLHHVNQS